MPQPRDASAAVRRFARIQAVSLAIKLGALAILLVLVAKYWRVF